ncbi:MAG: OmpA family protein [Candidatus Korobacteraceae bacterium]
MSTGKTVRMTLVLAVAVAIMFACGVAFAQSAQLQGLITGRSGATMTVQSQDSGNVVVVLTPATQVEEVSGLFHARKKQYAMTALVPGLSVQVQGAYNAQNQMVADTVKFKGSSLSTAQDIQAGVTPVEQQEQAQKQKLQQQQTQLQQQQAQLTHEQQQQAAEAAKIAANKAAIAAANKRFGELGDYNILGEVTVYFANGSTAVEDQYKPQLQKLAKQAMSINGYIIQVQGYASAVGSAALNQKLSSERAANVLDLLEQQDGIPLTNVLAPGAMGTADQVAADSTAEGQAANRRVVVRILQNKGISGT